LGGERRNGEPDQLPVTEQASIKPATSPYGNTKQINEEIVKDTVTSRFSNQCNSSSLL